MTRIYRTLSEYRADAARLLLDGWRVEREERRRQSRIEALAAGRWYPRWEWVIRYERRSSSTV